MYLFTMLFAGLLCLVLGVLVKYGKCYWLISGYNTMSEEKRQRVDVEGLANFLGNCTFVLAGQMIISGLFFHYNHQLVAVAAVFSIFPLIVYLLIIAQRFDGNTRNTDGTMKRTTKAMIGFFIALFVVISIFIVLSARTPRVLINDKVLQIKAVYGLEIERDKISDIKLTVTPPDVVGKTNGFDLGNILKGKFRLRGGTAVRLYVNIGKPPFIEITTSEGLVIINLADPEKTEALFHSLIRCLRAD